jgi:hypothetical protein
MCYYVRLVDDQLTDHLVRPVRTALEPVLARGQSWDHEPKLHSNPGKNGALELSRALPQRPLQQTSHRWRQAGRLERDRVRRTARDAEPDGVACPRGNAGRDKPMELAVLVHLQPYDV